MRFRIRHAVTVLTVCALVWLVHLSSVFFHKLPEQVLSFSNEREDDIQQSMGADLELLKVRHHEELKSDNIGSIPVFVVEEHHEVLRYWFGSAEKGLIPKEGNTLFHIDGHSDAATPLFLDIIPLFRRPKSREEVFNMMQRNDVFIAAAGLGKLINRYIWVWPSWDEQNHASAHEAFDMEAGIFAGNGSTRLCGCVKSHFNSSDSFCVRQDPVKDDYMSVPINRTDCGLIFSGLVEGVSETKAIELLNEGNWLTAKDNVILDIDEDYYGCETVLQTLEDANITLDMVNKLSSRIQYLFCPVTVIQETAADDFFHTIIEIILEMKSHCGNSHFQKQCTGLNLHNALVGMIPDLLDSVYKEHATGMLCQGKHDLMNGLMVQTLVQHLTTFTTPQLKVLSEIGVCLETAVTSFIESSDGLRLCHGSNLPNETIVLYHSPTPKEIQERTKTLHSLLHSGSFTPHMVTICRSVRDDYTPRSYFHKIEGDILKVLHESFSDIHWATVYYDKHLLGGKRGWPRRHH
ncbi:UPF0489 protein C5orf22 homolog [Gigantopelta aegis]|uniref:UPF0489 protein C5orf22 homolog n=1 Tax=Gigantopelta aegis TaxID=1735272 RepID=UPI001B88B5A0|nr:UPF0489 protein C5orf22 homolog [Gigantopelta aegis]